jgi:hypothetical protein
MREQKTIPSQTRVQDPETTKSPWHPQMNAARLLQRFYRIHGQDDAAKDETGAKS